MNPNEINNLTGKPLHLTFTRVERAFLVGVPLLWAVLLLFLLIQAARRTYFFPVVTDHVTSWLAVHVGTLVFVPLMAAVVFLLLRGLESRWASVARAGVLAHAVAYTAWEVLVGIGTGILVSEVNALAGEEALAGIDLIERFNESSLLLVMLVVGGTGLSVGLIAAGQALVSEAGSPRSVSSS